MRVGDSPSVVQRERTWSNNSFWEGGGVEDGAMRATPQRRRDALIFSVAGNPRDPQVRPVAFEAVQHSLIIFMHSRVTQSAFINSARAVGVCRFTRGCGSFIRKIQNSRIPLGRPVWKNKLQLDTFFRRNLFCKHSAPPPHSIYRLPVASRCERRCINITRWVEKVFHLEFDNLGIRCSMRDCAKKQIIRSGEPLRRFVYLSLINPSFVSRF